MKRRAFMLLPAALLAVGCRRPDRSVVLGGLVRDVMAGMARELSQRTRELHLAVTSFGAAPSIATREQARRRFGGAALAWKRAQAFPAGPFVSTQAFQRAAFWPPRKPAIEAVLALPRVDEALVEGLGADARGLWALEYALFAARAPEEKLADYARELSGNIFGYAQRISRELGDGRAFARCFAEQGAQSVNALCAHSSDTLEIVRGKLERARRSPPELAVEGFHSGISTAVVGALLSGAERVYRGGLEELAAEVEPRITPRVRGAFALVQRRVSSLVPQLDLAAVTQPDAFDAAMGALAELKHVYEVELRSALEG